MSHVETALIIDAQREVSLDLVWLLHRQRVERDSPWS